jgi:hypothetical protein
VSKGIDCSSIEILEASNEVGNVCVINFNVLTTILHGWP